MRSTFGLALAVMVGVGAWMHTEAATFSESLESFTSSPVDVEVVGLANEDEEIVGFSELSIVEAEEEPVESFPLEEAVSLPPAPPVRCTVVLRNCTAQDSLQALREASVAHGVRFEVLHCLAMRESRLNPYAVSHTSDYGLMQFHVYTHGGSLMRSTSYPDSPFSPWYSALAAAELISRGQGHHWTTWPSCRYQ